jgi:hypothetical protein
MSWVARVTALIDMMVSAALLGNGGSACSYSILIFPIRVEYDMLLSLRRFDLVGCELSRAIEQFWP